MQILPSAAASQGSVTHQWQESPGTEERAHAADGTHAGTTPRSRSGSHSGEFQLIFSAFSSFHDDGTARF